MTKPTATVRSYEVTLDTTLRPQDDFFGYVNNKWLAANPIPPTESRWGTFNILREDSWKAMHAIYLELADKADLPQNSIEQQARDFFYTGMHKDELTAAHTAFIESQLQLLHDIQNTTELAQHIGRLQAMGVNGPWRVFVDADEKDSTAHIFRIHQGGQTLPDRDYYLETSDKMKSIRTAYKKHLAAVHAQFPALDVASAAFSKEILQFETDLAKISRTQTDLRDVERNFNKTSFADLQKTYPAIDWPAYAKALGWKTSDQISVDQPEYLACVNEQFTARPLAQWKTYLAWEFLKSFHGKISEKMAELHFSFFGKILSGTPEMMPLNKRVTLMIDAAMGDGVGKLYVERHFSESAKQQVLDMVETIRATYKKRITALTWMAEPTKKHALRKLANMKVLIGYPDTWRDFSAMPIGRTSYIENCVAAELHSTAYWLAKLHIPISRDDWFMYPQTVNAYNDPNRLVICFPAAILQPPFFDPAAPLAVNLGGIGAVIGHEFTHGFDDQGCQFDDHGNVKLWQTEADRQAFDKQAQIVIDQADHFEVLPGLTLQGKLVIGESIADLGGLELAYDALRSTLGAKISVPAENGYTPEQQFFFSYATTECSHSREEKLREYALSDPHPNSQFRVNAIVQHVDAFYRVFDVNLGDKLYREPGERARIW